ncbi:Alpha/Beta hydrolase protein [Aspergillus pseudodeflectus]|uniref:Alpha/Beta hydrolase protein n=1 Tax=Aspergillus pseudodeflectus TaxID=176178 RepID=A0ABR4KGK7_9EURO
MTPEFAPAWRKFIDEFGESPALSGSLAEIESGWLKILERLVAKYEIPPPDDSVQTEDVTLESFWVRVYTPPETTKRDSKASTPNAKAKPAPVGIYLHGGGWTMGSVDQEDGFCRLVSKSHNMTIVSVSYRLAPEHKYPAALDDCVDATIWASKYLHASSFILIGASAGGNLAFGTALKLLDRHSDLAKNLLNGVVALVPVTVHPDAVPASIKAAGLYNSYEANATATVNTASAMASFFTAYGAPRDDKYTSCLLHPRLRELKKVYIAECGADTLRDDARLMRRKLEREGVPTVYDAYPGFPHYSWTFPSKHLEEHRNVFLGRVMEGVRWVGGFKAAQL